MFASISCFAIFADLEDLVLAVDIWQGMTCCCRMCQVYRDEPSPEAAAHCMCFNSLHWRCVCMCVCVCVCVLCVYTSHVPWACMCSYIRINMSKGNSIKCVFEMCLVSVCVCVWRTSSVAPFCILCVCGRPIVGRLVSLTTHRTAHHHNKITQLRTKCS